MKKIRIDIREMIDRFPVEWTTPTRLNKAEYCVTHARTNASIPRVVGRESTGGRFMQTAVYAPPGARHPTETRSNPKMHDWKTSTVLPPPPRDSWI